LAEGVKGKSSMRCHLPISIIIVVGLLPAAALSQTFPFETIDLADGLPQSQVTCLAQDAEGYIWVGTHGGLARFNGMRFANYLVEDGLPSSQIQDILVDRRGVLWIATRSGLGLWRDYRMSTVTDPAVSGIFCRSLAEDAHGNLWVGTDQGLVLKQGQTFTSVLDNRRQTLGLVYSLLAEEAGVIIVSTRGLFRAQAKMPVVKLEDPEVPKSALRSIGRTAEGLWAGSSGYGLFVQSGSRWAPVRIQARTITRMFTSASGAFYVASLDAGLFRRLPRQTVFESLTAANGLPSNMINCVFEDAQKNLWVGTEMGGLARLRSSAVRNYDQTAGLPNPCVFGISPSGRRGELWMSTMKGLARCRVEGGFKVLETLTTRDGLDNDFVWNAVASPQGELWVMTDSAFQLRAPGQRRFRHLPKNLAIPRQEVSCLCLDYQGRVWLAGTDPVAPLAVRDEAGRWRSWMQSQEGKSILHSWTVVPRRAGGVWVGAEGRILSSDGLRLQETDKGLPVPAGTHIIAMLEDGRGRLWVGTEGDLFVREPRGEWQTIKGEPGLNFSQVYFIGEDPQGTIWVGVSNGVLCIKASGQVEPFTLEEGLAGLETNQFGFLSTPDGTVWIGTVSGLSQISLDQLTTISRPVPLIVEAAELAGRVIPHPKSLDLSWHDRAITFRISVLSFKRRRGSFFRARLEGMEKDWLITRRSGSIRYTNIPPGKYELVLQAGLDPGKWGEKTVIPIHIQTPFWLSWWFRLGAVAFVSAAIVGLYLGRTKLLRQRAEDLERIIAERTDKLVEANEELERLATHDPLTGLWNRRAILNRLEEVCRSSAPSRGRQPLGLIIIDLDDFKGVNDALGHICGDIVLRAVARQIETQIRQGDAVGRYGGDEFLVILPGADREALESVVQRIAGTNYDIPVEGQSVIITASCGALAVSGESVPNAVALLAQADGLLIRSKKSGKHSYLIGALAGLSADRHSA
jgi:diguanylate cyclase (GGDEF)-like protein